MSNRSARERPLTWTAAVLLPLAAGRLWWSHPPDGVTPVAPADLLGLLLVSLTHASLGAVFLVGAWQACQLMREGDASRTATLERRRRARGVMEAFLGLSVLAVVAVAAVGALLALTIG